MNQLLVHGTYAVQQGNLRYMQSKTGSSQSEVSVCQNTERLQIC